MMLLQRTMPEAEAAMVALLLLLLLLIDDGSSRSSSSSWNGVRMQQQPQGLASTT